MAAYLNFQSKKLIVPNKILYTFSLKIILKKRKTMAKIIV